MGMKFVTFTVMGTGAFPIDMLRYDSCYPKSQDDVGAIIAERSTGNKRVTLVHRTADGVANIKKNYPTVARWSSFNWHLVDGPHVAF